MEESARSSIFIVFFFDVRCSAFPCPSFDVGRSLLNVESSLFPNTPSFNLEPGTWNLTASSPTATGIKQINPLDLDHLPDHRY